MSRSRSEHDDVVPDSIVPGEEDLTPVFGSVGTNNIPHKIRPDSASSEDYSSSSSCGMDNSIRRTKNRKTWRQSLQEQDDELELLSVHDWQSKCKNLQSMVHKLQDNLLVVNTECTRLQNNQIQSQQNKTQTELESKKLQWENERLTVQLNLTNEENMRLRDSCQESDINVIKLRNEFLNAKTEAGKAARELDIVKRTSMDHTDCIATEERLMGTVAAIKKELNLLREDVANLNDKAHKRGRTIKELESKVREKDTAIGHLEEKMRQGTPTQAEEQAASPATASDHSKYEATEKQLRAEVKSLKEEIAVMGSNMNTWFSQVQGMKKLCNNGVLGDDQSWSDLGTQMKSATLSSLLYEVQEQVKEEVEYSKQLAVFCKESTLRLATAMKKDINFTEGAESGIKMAVDLVEQACGTIGRVEEAQEVSGNTNQDLQENQDKIHGLLDRWIVNANSVKSTCSERTFMTVAATFVPDTFEGKLEYFSDIMQCLSQYVSNSFDRIEDDFKRKMNSLKERVQLFTELKQHMNDFAITIGMSSPSSDPASCFKAFELAFKEASAKGENNSASEDLRMQVNQLTRENEEHLMRIKELQSLPVSSDIFSEKHAALVKGLQEIHELYDDKLSILEKFSELKVDFVANGLSETTPQAAELKAMQDNLVSITTKIDNKEESTMGLVQGISTWIGGTVHSQSPPLDPASADLAQWQASEKSLNEIIETLKEDVNNANQRISQLSTEVHDKDQTIGQLEEMLRVADITKSSIEGKLQEAEEYLAKERSDCEETTKRTTNESIVALKEELRKVTNNVEDLSNELLNKDQALKQQEEKLKETVAAKAEIEVKLQEVIESSSQELVQITIANSQCHVNEKNLNESLETLKGELQNTSDNVTDLTKKLQEKEDVIKDLEGKLTDANLKLEESEEVLGVTDLTKKLQEKEDVIKDLERKLTVANLKLEESEEVLGVTDLTKKLEEKEDVIKDLEGKLTDANLKLEESEEVLGVTDLTKKLEEKEDVIKDLEGKLTDANLKLEESEEVLGVTDLTKKLQEKEDVIKDLEGKLTDANLKLEESEEVLGVTDLTKKLQEKEDVIKDLEGKLTDANLKLEESEEVLGVTDLTRKLQEKEDVIKDLEGKLKDANLKLEESEEVLGDCVSTEENLAAEIKKATTEYNDEITTIKAQLDALVEEKSQLKDDLAAKETFILKQNHDLAHLRDELHQDAQCQLELNTTIELLNKRIQEAEEKMNVTTVENSENSLEIDKRIEVLQEELKAERQQNAQILAGNTEEHSANIATLMADHQKELSLLKAEIDGLNVKLEKNEETEVVKTLREKCEATEALNMPLKAEVESTKENMSSENVTSVTNFEAPEAAFAEQCINLRAEVEHLTKSLAEKDQDIVQYSEQVKQHAEEHSANIATLMADHQKELSLLKAEIDGLNVKLETNEETEVVKTLREKCEATEALNMSLKAEVESTKENMSSENVALVIDFEAREAAFAEQCINLRAEVEHLTKSLAEKDQDIVQYSEQVKQHAVTIVAIEERLNQVIEKNKQYREDIDKQNHQIRDYQLKLEEWGKQQVEHVTIVNDVSSTSNQSLTHLHKENASLKSQTKQAQKVISALRRDIAGLGARLGDVTGDIDEATKRELDEKRVKLSDADRELAAHKSKVKSLFTVIDEKLAETKRLIAETHKLKEAVVRLKKLVEERDEHVKTLQDKLDKGQTEKEKMKTEFDEQGRITKELAAHGAACRGERHVEVIANQRAALTELRTQIRDLELWPRPVPTHEAALQQVMVLKKELSELRVRESLSHTVPSAVQNISSQATTSEGVIEKSAHLVTMETLDMSENSYLALLRAISTSLDIEDVAGLRRLSHIPADEQLKLFREREQSCAIVSNRITLLRERLKRKEELLSGYEQDLAKLHRLEEVSGAQEQQVNNLTNEIRHRTEESQCLRVSLERARLRTDPNRRYVSAVHEDKKLPALHHHHCVPLDPITAKTQAAKSRDASELMKKKNYEIKTLRTELGRKDHQLDKYRRTLSEKTEKTPVPPLGRPSSAKVRRPRPAVKPKRPASAKLQTATTPTARRSPSPPRSSRTPRDLVEDEYTVISSTENIKQSLGEKIDEVKVQTSESFREGGVTVTRETLYTTAASESQSAGAATAGASFLASEIASSMMSPGGRVSFITETKVDEGDSSEF